MCIIGFAACLTSVSIAQHVPPCQGAAHSTSICYGYATARAFGRTWNDSRCYASTLYFNGMSTTYFDHFTSFSYSNIQPGDIVEFTGHVAYACSISTRDNNGIFVDQVDGENQPEQKNLKLDWVINGHSSPPYVQTRGNPIGYFRKKALWSVKVQNEFTGGKVGVGVGAPVSEKDSPHTVSSIHWETSVNIDAVMDGRVHDGYVRLFKEWIKGTEVVSNVKSTTVVITDYSYSSPINYTARFDRQFDVTFKNNFVGMGNGGIIKVDGQNRNSPFTTQVKDGNSITAQALPQTLSYIDYSFDHWSDGSTSAQKTFIPTDNTTYTAYFVGKPVHVTITSSSGPVGTNIRIVWAEHPNLNVSQYQVWRKVKHQGQWQGPTLLATLDRGTTSFTDDEYIYTSGYTDDLLNYDIRAYYSTEGTYADPYWVTAYGELYRQLPIKDRATSLPSEYAITNFPNPFNPTTKIHFQLVDDSQTILEIYDLLGRRIVRLLDDHLTAGGYTIEWKGTDENGNGLASGIYLVRMVAKPLHGGELRMLTQLMLLVK